MRDEYLFLSKSGVVGNDVSVDSTGLCTVISAAAGRGLAIMNARLGVVGAQLDRRRDRFSRATELADGLVSLRQLVERNRLA